MSWVSSTALSLRWLMLPSASSSLLLNPTSVFFSSTLVFFSSVTSMVLFLYFQTLCWSSHWIYSFFSLVLWESLWPIFWTIFQVNNSTISLRFSSHPTVPRKVYVFNLEHISSFSITLCWFPYFRWNNHLPQSWKSASCRSEPCISTLSQFCYHPNLCACPSSLLYF